MEISRTLLENYDVKNPPNGEKLTVDFPRLFQQGKQISQIISYIWRWSDDIGLKGETARQLAEFFKHPSDSKLEKLFSAKPKSAGNSEEKLLYEVFHDVTFDDSCTTNQYRNGYFFPIFSEEEVRYYDFTIDTNNFQGTIEDANLNHSKLMKLLTPFPPCPKFGEATIKIDNEDESKDELITWIKDRDTEKMISDNPYIPTCTS